MSLLYLHETLTFQPGGLDRYLAELTATRDRLATLEGLRNVGVWRTLGTSGHWHELTLLWEVDGWDAWARLQTGPNPPRAGVIDWIDRDWQWRKEGYGRILEPAGFSPSLAEIQANGPRGALFIHEIIQVVPGKKAAYLERFERDWLPITRKAGRELVGAYSILESNLQVLIILAIPSYERHAQGMRERLSAEDRARWSAGASAIRTDWALKLLEPAPWCAVAG